MCLAGSRREKTVPSPCLRAPPPATAWGRRKPAGLSRRRVAGARLTVPASSSSLPGCAPGPAPSPGFPRSLFSLSLCLCFSFSGSPVPTRSRCRPARVPGWFPLTFFFPGVKTLLASGRLLADIIGRRPARRPRPRAPLRPPLRARVAAAAAAPSGACVRVCECAPASVSVCAPRARAGQHSDRGGSWAAASSVERARRRRRQPGRGRDRGWDSGGRAGHGAGKPALRQDAPASRDLEALRRPARGLPNPGQANFSFSFALPRDFGVRGGLAADGRRAGACPSGGVEAAAGKPSVRLRPPGSSPRRGEGARAVRVPGLEAVGSERAAGRGVGTGKAGVRPRPRSPPRRGVEGAGRAG
ncbi:Triple Functional Domain Protein [Manis pentadactyla]|nr:Triple Functional Domain Protein [Manis pentadactyla]